MVNNSDVFKVLMLWKPDLELVGACLYTENKKDGNNLAIIELFCTKWPRAGLGSRLMMHFLSYASRKKFYCDVLVQADITAIEFFYNFYFVLIDFNDLSESRKELIRLQ